MSRPILSRPRTRVYGCNYDKGESYYKPMVDHLDRKYSSRPLFSEPRTSLADEIAARRSDIGKHDLSGPRNSSFGRDPDLEFDPSIRTPQLPMSSLATDTLFPENEDVVYDSHGQRSRLRFAENFANDVIATTQHLKTKLAACGLDSEVDLALGRPRQLRHEQDFSEDILNARKDMQSLKSATENVGITFKRNSTLSDEIDNLGKNTSFAKWTKLINEDENLIPVSAAATRAKQTKARLNDLESEMEELAERQAKRERRAAALRALVNEAATDIEHVQEQSSAINKKVSIRNERLEKHVAF